MKHTQEIEPGIQASFDAAVDWQTKPLLVSGPADLIVDLHKEAEEYVARTGRVASLSPKLARVAVPKPETPLAPVYEFPTRKEKVAQYFADAKLRKFDRLFGTDLYEEKQETRRKQAIFLMAGEAGLFDRSSDYYKSQLRRLAK